MVEWALRSTIMSDGRTPSLRVSRQERQGLPGRGRSVGLFPGVTVFGRFSNGCGEYFGAGTPCRFVYLLFKLTACMFILAVAAGGGSFHVVCFSFFSLRSSSERLCRVVCATAVCSFV